MGTIGHGYGSEWHLLHHLGYHRSYLNQKILKISGGDSVSWEDFLFSKKSTPLQDDQEIKGLDFIKGQSVLDKWKDYWPQTGNAQN